MYLWPASYKPRIPVFDGKSNPRKFLTSYETSITSARGDAQILAKSLIMVVEDIAHDWYTSLKPLSIRSWGQVRAELVSTFQGYHPGTKTTRDLLAFSEMNPCLSFWKGAKAQVPNALEETVVAAALEGLAMGQCAAHFTRNYPTSVWELFEVMRQHARLDDDLKKQKVTRNSWRQKGKAPRPPPTPSQRNMRPFRAINNLQEQPEHNSAEQSLQGPPPNQQHRSFDQSPRGGREG